MKTETLSHRERFLLAARNQKPDRVPACPCLSNMVPCKRTGKPFWDVYLHHNPPLWKAYLDASRYFGLDGRMIYGGLKFKQPTNVTRRQDIISSSETELLLRETFHTSAGELVGEYLYQHDNPPTPTAKMIKDLATDLPKLRELFAPPTGYEHGDADEMRRETGEDAVFCLSITYPGFHRFHDLFEGGLETATMAACDEPDLMEELRVILHEQAVRQAEMILDYRPDILYFGGSGTLTLSTPAWVRQYTLPTLKQITRMAKHAGVTTMLHSCGKSRALVEMLANETDLDCINPLEMPPQGDVDLAEVKAKFGKRLALSGNIHTTNTMLLGTPAGVDRACREAIEAAGTDGGFILMTGDQCGRDTPEANIFAFVEAAKRYGRY